MTRYLTATVWIVILGRLSSADSQVSPTDTAASKQDNTDGDRFSAISASLKVKGGYPGYPSAQRDGQYPGAKPHNGAAVSALQVEGGVVQRGNRVRNVSVACDQRQFSVHVEFTQPFRGLIYTGEPRCNLVTATTGNLGFSSLSRRHSFTIGLNTCDTVAKQETDQATGEQYTDYSSILWIQPNARLLRGGTAVYQLICRIHLSKLGTISSRVVTDRIHVIPPDAQVVQSSAQVDKEMRVQFSSHILFGEGPFGPPVDRSIALGERLTYVFRCVPVAGVDCAVGRCSAKGVTGTTEVQLTDQDGCSLQPHFWSNFKLDQTGSKLENLFTSSIWAWSLHSDDNIVLTCQLRACAGVCERRQCAAIDPETRQRDQVVGPSVTVDIDPNPSLHSQLAVHVDESAQRQNSVKRTVASSHRRTVAEAAHTTADQSDRKTDVVTVSRPLLAALIVILLVTVASLSFIILMLLYKLHQLASSYYS